MDILVRRSFFILPIEKSITEENVKDSTRGGNPLLGKENRAPGSSFCPSCKGYHKLKTICPRFVERFDKARTTHSPVSGNRGGNPWHDESGKFTSAPKSSRSEKKGRSDKIKPESDFDLDKFNKEHEDAYEKLRESSKRSNESSLPRTTQTPPPSRVGLRAFPGIGSAYGMGRTQGEGMGQPGGVAQATATNVPQVFRYAHTMLNPKNNKIVKKP